MRHAARIAVFVFLAACGNRGSVTFSILAPAYAPLNPITDQVTDYSIKKLDGTLIGVASETGSGEQTLSLGPLMPQMMPIDVQVNVQSGSTLLGMARVRDVAIENAVEKEYAVYVRKPLITIGSDLPLESIPGNAAQQGQILDPTTPDPQQSNLSSLPDGPKLPDRTSAAAATWDGRYLFAANDSGISVIDTGTGTTVGMVPLGFRPVRLAVGAHDSSLAALEVVDVTSGGTSAVTLFNDVAGLIANPSAATGMQVPLPGETRTMTFSPDGQSLYALGGRPIDPCSPTSKVPAPNGLTVLGLDGAMLGSWTFPGFVADIALDAATGRVVVTDDTNGLVGVFDPSMPFGPVQPQKIADATCPNGVRVANGDAFVLTNGRDKSFNPPAFILLRVPVKGGSPNAIPFTSPTYSQVNIGDMPTPDGSTKVTFQFVPTSLNAYEMAITPDATRLVFATRARYSESGAPLTVFTNNCTATFEIIEYGVYSLDTRVGTATYTMHSQIIGTATGRLSACIDCKVDNGPFAPPSDVPLPCGSIPGDRVTGISAIFGGY
jgi:hypothetical protein